MPRFLTFALSALASLAAALPALPAAAQVPQNRVQILPYVPFDPPIGEPMRYDLTVERTRNGVLESATFEQQITYNFDDERFLLTVENLRMSDGALPLASEGASGGITSAIQSLLGPITYELDDYGGILRIVDWDDVKQRLNAVPAMIAAQAPAGERYRARQIAERSLIPFMEMSAEDAAQVMDRIWPSILGWAYAEYEEGQTVTVEGETQSPIAPVMLPQVSKHSFAHNEEGDLVLTLTEGTDGDAVRNVLLSYFERVVPADQPDRETIISNIQRDVEGIQFRSQLEIVFDPVSGMIQRGMTSRLVQMTSETGGDRFEIVLVDPEAE